jgi:dihydroorotate dehydrogenase
MTAVDGTSSGSPDELAALAEKITAIQSQQVPAVLELFAARAGVQPPFDHLHDFWFNFADGPRDGVPPIESSAPVLPTKLLDFNLNFPIGVPACALTPHARYIEYFAKRGFDLLTYKTVRDRPWNPHPFPQWAFAPTVNEPLGHADIAQNHVRDSIVATLDPTEVSDFRRASLVNSFGVPSLPVEQWKADVADSRGALSPGQVLIVSVMGSPDHPETQHDADLIAQFARTAAHAAEAGADIVELNLSCPNTGGELICTKPEFSAEVARAVQRELKSWDVPIFIKISYLAPGDLQELIKQCERYIRGVVAINTLLAKTEHSDGTAFFASYRRSDGREVSRPMAGLSGVGIREVGLATIRELARIREARGSSSEWVIVANGGMMCPDDFMAYKNEGADAVQSCSGAWLNPRLAIETRNAFGRPSERQPHESTPGALSVVLAKVGELLAAGGLSTRSRE